jgi:hypothetical protein
MLVTEAADLNVDEPGEFAGEILDVDAGTAINVGGVLVGEEEGGHEERMKEEL